MGWSDPYYSLTLDVTGVRFYGSEAELSSASIFIESDASASGLRIATASATISSDSTASFSAGKVYFASTSIDSIAFVAASSSEILKALFIPSISSNLVVSSSKDTFAQSSLLIQSEVSVNAIEILLTGSDISVESNAAISGLIIELASTSINVESDTTVSAKEIVLANQNITIQSDLQVSAYKIAKAISSINTESSAQFTSIKIAKASSIISPEVSVSALIRRTARASFSAFIDLTASSDGTKIAFAQSDITDLITVVVAAFKEIVLASSSILIESDFYKPKPIRASESFSIASGLPEDRQYIRTILFIDGKPLTEHNRNMSMSLEKNYVENVNWEGSRGRYFKDYRSGKISGKRVWSIDWTYVPNTKSATVDQRDSRDFLKKIAEDPDFHVLKLTNLDTDGSNIYSQEEYNVLVTSYQERLVRREVSAGVFYWDCSIQLEEVV